MHRPELSEDEPAGAPAWMVTFADLMSLLLTFFVLLLSFSHTEVVKFRQAMGSIRNAFGLMSENESSQVPIGDDTVTEDLTNIGGHGLTPEQLEQQLQAVLEEHGLEGRGEARQTMHGVVLQVEGDLMFDSGKAELSENSFAMLEGLARYIAQVEHHVDVVGHTDNVPISTSVFPSNWELSAARAGQAVRYLVEHGVPAGRLRAIGQADTVPIAGNETPGGRAANRRVEFVFASPAVGDLPKKPLEELGPEDIPERVVDEAPPADTVPEGDPSAAAAAATGE